jgi:carbonic anhydrase/acetyltransferase-like protein (isoleucine patch superfamily)
MNMPSAICKLSESHFIPANYLKMAIIKAVKGIVPNIGRNCFLADNATVVGDVVIGNDCSIWFNAVVRGDVNYIRIGNKVNIQDGVIIHCTYRISPVNIGSNVSIAHNAVIHGCTIHDNVLIGMGAILMDHVVVGSNSIIAAGALLTKDTIVEEGSVYAGMPARKIKSIDRNLSEGEILRIANSYNMYAGWYTI